MNERIYVAIDVESTGLVAGVDELIEVAAVKFRGEEVLETYSQLVRPRQSLSLKITRLTGITPEDLAAAPTFNEIGADLARFIKSYPIVGHSVGFDLGMLRAQGMSFAQPVYDTFELATLLVPQAPIYKLGALAEYFGIPHPEDHRALNDALVAAQVFDRLLVAIDDLPMHDLKELVRLAKKISFPMLDIFEAGLREKIKQGFQEDVHRQVATPIPPFDVQPLAPTGDSRPIDIELLAEFLGPNGALSRQLSGYEPREPQVTMARAVATTFNESGSLLVEAGTGTGKSLAYLTPAIIFAAIRGERVVISTNTINLQDQLCSKDIPDLRNIMDQEGLPKGDGDYVFPEWGKPVFKMALLKGRSNYLCLKRYHELRRHENLSPDEVRAVMKVQLWIPTTLSGDKAELLLMDREAAAWPRINATPETCTGPRCTHFRDCFFFRARREAEGAHILVVNHALLIADLASQSNVLPPYDHLVIDEAHNLEDVATDQLSFAVDEGALMQFFDDIFLSGGVQIVSGILAELPNLTQRLNNSFIREKIEQAGEQLRPTLERARSGVRSCFALLNSFVAREAQEHQYDARVRLTPSLRRKPAWVEIQEAWENVADSMMVIDQNLAQIALYIGNLSDELVDGFEDLVLRVEHLNRFATEARIKMGHIIFGDEENIAWLTLDRQRGFLTLTAAPLSVAGLLQAQLFNHKQTTILASATLTVESDFSFVKHRVGIAGGKELILESPFDYERQALVYIPTDIPEPNQRGYQQAVEQALIELCTATGGRTLALFTANSALKQTYAAIQEPLEEHEIAVLGQGIDGSRRALLERFKEFPRTVLLGTTSFWEGVDVVGDALSVLVIAKLPFSVPTDPIYAARSERFADPFGEYAVPQSILRFKQGFGRLIRSREDRGIVVVLDKRLLTKKYGAQFLDSLPNTRVRTGPLKQLPALAARFLV